MGVKPKGGRGAFAAKLLIHTLLAFQTATAIPTISVKGAKFFTSDGDQFYIKGVVYAADISNLDNLVNGTQCELDAPLLKELGANVIRVYTVDPTLDHDRCMQAFSDAGIYLLLDMTTSLSETFFISRSNPRWTKDMRNAFAQVVDGFQKYDNLLGFFAGNEVINDKKTSNVAAYVKAAIADMKAYRDFMGYREIPIGYAANDDAELRVLQQDYFDCGNSSIAADFYAVNRYTWCGSSSMAKSGYDTLYAEAEGYDIPTFLSETGCRTDSGGNSEIPNREFTDQTALLGRQMNDRFSGNIIYEWAQGVNQYGLVSYSNSAATGRPSLFPDYTSLSKQWATLTPAGTKQSDYNPSLTKRDCPAFTSGTWEANAAALPTLGTSGFTAPPSSATGSTASRTGSATTGAALTGESTGVGEKPEKKGVSGGVIAGAVLGALVVLALILGVALFFIRRARRRRGDGAGGKSVTEGDKMLAVAEAKHKHGYYGSDYHELPGYGQAQELDPSRGYIATMGANELAQPHRDHELHDGQGPQEAYTPKAAAVEPGPVSNEPAAAPEPSPYVQAQRKLEMNWLESEEARLRQRREALMQQNGGGA